MKIFVAKGIDENKKKSKLEDILILCPSSNPWNDQGYSTVYDLHIFKRNGISKTLDRFTRLYFEEERGNYEYVLSLDNSIELSSVEKKFLSQIDNEDDFAALVSAFDHEVALEILERIHDASVLRNKNKNDENLELVDNRIFQTSLLRSNTAYMAFFHGPSVFFEKVHVSPPEINLNFKLTSFQNEHELQLSFKDNSFFGSRIGIIVGKNGCGKSQTIKKLIENLLRGVSDDQNGRCDFNKIIVFSNVVTDVYPKEYEDNRNYYYRYLNLIDDKKVNTLTDVIKVILKGGYSNIIKKKRLDLLIELLKKNINFDRILLPVRPNKNTESMLQKNSYVSLDKYFNLKKEVEIVDYLMSIESDKKAIYKKDGKVIELSTGQEFFSNLVGNLVANVDSGSFLMFDEPETYLHPNLEVDLISILEEVLQATNSYALIATHSIYITREVPSEHVRIYTERDGNINITKPQIQTFGSSLDQISDYIFGDISRQKSYQKKLKEKMDNYNSFEDFFEQHSEDLNPSTILYLSSRSKS